MPPKVNANAQASGSGGSTDGNGAGNGEGDVRVVMEYDREDGVDQGEVAGKLNQIANLAYDAQHVHKWVRRLERRMEMASIREQWTKRLVLESALPSHLYDDMDELFDKRKAECGLIYYDCKALLLELHGPSPERDFEMAMDMVMPPGMKPSQAAKRLVQLICKFKKQLTDCSCSIAVSSRWRRRLPDMVKSSVSCFDLRTDFLRATQTADKVWMSLQTTQAVAAVQPGLPAAGAGAAGAASGTDEVAAYGQAGAAAGQSRGGRGARRGSGRGNRGGAQGRGGASAGQSAASQAEQGPPPPENCCKMHKRHKKKAFYCSAPESCPWKNYKYQPMDNQ